MESITVALITVVIPLVASRFTVMRADKRDKEIQDLARELSMDHVADIIEDRRRQRIYRDALFKWVRQASFLALFYAVFFAGLLLFLLRDELVETYAEDAPFWILIVLAVCSVFFLGWAYFFDLYSSRELRRILRLEKSMKRTIEIQEQILTLSEEQRTIQLKVEHGHELTDDEKKTLVKFEALLDEFVEINDKTPPPGFWKNLFVKIRLFRKGSDEGAGYRAENL